MSARVLAVCGLLLFCFAPSLAVAEQPVSGKKPLTEMPSVVTVPPAAQPSDHFDPEAATNAYLAEIPAEARARSDAYFEGGYWLILWDFLCGALVALLLLDLRWSARMRDFAEHITRFSLYAIRAIAAKSEGERP